jgi:hypothetical protein
MTKRTIRMLLAATALLTAKHAAAGLLDSPAPIFYGVQGQVVYRMGAIYYHPGQVDTVVTCKNLDDAQVSVAIELFDQRDDRAGTVAHADLPVGGSVTFVTSAGQGREQWVIIHDLVPLDHGKARVSATTTKLSCTGYHRRVSGDNVRDTPLELVKRVIRPGRP